MNISRTDRRYSFHFEDPLCFSKLVTTIHSFLLDYNTDWSREIIYLCIGTDRATGDCLGPLVGTRLQTLLPPDHIFGTLENPVHATNLPVILEQIAASFHSPLIIAIDASLGNADRIGFINVNEGSLKPGTALKKILPAVGDFHISGVVNVGGFLEQMVLQNTRLYIVYRMADLVARSIYLANIRLNVDKRAANKDLVSAPNFANRLTSLSTP